MENKAQTREEIKKLLLEHPMDPEMVKKIIHRFDLDDVNLDVEHLKIQNKESNLSARQRKVVEELIVLKSVTEEIEKDKTNAEELKETVNFNTI